MARPTRSGPDVDPTLLRQLDAAAAGAQVQAVFGLADGALKAAESGPGGVEAAVRALVDGAAKASGLAPGRIKVFRLLGSFVAEAPPALLRALLASPAIATATANVQPKGTITSGS